ncbi:MAG: serine/threonine-protein kinase, partial [Verrucomicrobiota bacterium]|nr:serine/threonine-protein kinase [Verrucomicrobiota bacterium]
MSRTTTKIIIAQEDGTVVGQYFLGQGEHLIGREAHCTIQLEATHVSREHAKLIISADAIEIEDLGSTSGTSLDGISVKGRIPIQPGQKLWISDLYIDIERQGFGGLVEGSRLGDSRFTLKRELGKGGMGAVWLALYEETQENFALKLVSGEISLDPKCLKELQREVNKSHNLVHPNIVRMGYFWKEEGEPAFISLEYVDGTDLHQLRSDSPNGLLAWKDIQTYMLQLCDALEYAHTQKVAHRDIKPSNFMIDTEG